MASSIPDVVRTSVWEDFYNADYYARYFSMMAGKYRTRHHCLRFALLALILIEATVITLAVPILSSPWDVLLVVAISAAIVLLTALDAVHNYATHSARLAVVGDEYQILCSEWRELWISIEIGSVDVEEVQNRQRVLLHRTHVLGVHIDLSTDNEFNQRSAKESARIMENQYAGTS